MCGSFRYVLKPQLLLVFGNTSFILLLWKLSLKCEQSYFLDCFTIFSRHFFSYACWILLQYLVAKSHMPCKFNLVFACLIASCYFLPEPPVNLTFDTSRSQGHSFLPTWTAMSSNFPYSNLHFLFFMFICIPQWHRRKFSWFPECSSTYIQPAFIQM